MAFRQAADRAATKVAYGFITRQLHPSLKDPVEAYLDKGFGVLEFGTTSTTLVREGWFGDKQVTLNVTDGGNIAVARN